MFLHRFIIKNEEIKDVSYWGPSDRIITTHFGCSSQGEYNWKTTVAKEELSLCFTKIYTTDFNSMDSELLAAFPSSLTPYFFAVIEPEELYAFSDPLIIFLEPSIAC